jgi:hypothetical protein
MKTLTVDQIRHAAPSVGLAEMRYVIVTLGKDGKPRRPTSQDLLWNGRRRMQEAEARKVELEALNPRRAFVILCR